MNFKNWGNDFYTRRDFQIVISNSHYSFVKEHLQYVKKKKSIVWKYYYTLHCKRNHALKKFGVYFNNYNKMKELISVISYSPFLSIYIGKNLFTMFASQWRDVWMFFYGFILCDQAFILSNNTMLPKTPWVVISKTSKETRIFPFLGWGFTKSATVIYLWL